RLTPDAKAHHDAFVGVGGRVTVIDPAAAPRFPGGHVAPLWQEADDADLLVDALFGTGLDRPLAGPLVDVVRTLNAVHPRRVALDVPAGLAAAPGAILGAAVECEATVTFGFRKTGLCTPRGARYAGEVHVVDIGVPSLVSWIGDPAAHIVEARDVAGWLARRA